MRDGLTQGDLTFTVATFDQPGTCDPHRAFETASRSIVLNTYETLLRYVPSAPGSLRPQLATEIPRPRQSGDEVHYHFPIRSRVRFHSGDLMTPDDVEYSLRRLLITGSGPGTLWAEAMIPDIGEPSPAQLRDALSRITATPRGVLVRLPNDFAPFLLLVANWSFVVCRSWCAARGDWSGDLNEIPDPLPDRALREETNGTGPFRLNRWDREQQELTFLRFNEYSGTLPPVTVVRMRSTDDRVRREEDLLSGRADFAVCQPESLSRLGSAPDVAVRESDQDWSVNPVGLLGHRLRPGADVLGSADFSPTGMPADALQDPWLRAALTFCFDYERFEREALDGRGVRNFGVFPRAALPDGPESEYRHDLDRARDLLRRAWSGAVAKQGIRLVCHTQRGNYAREVAAAILCEGFNALLPTARMEIYAVGMSEMLDGVTRGEVAIAWLGWSSDFTHPHACVAPLLSSTSRIARGLGINNRDTDKLIATALRGRTRAEANAIYGQIAAQLIREHRMIFVPGKRNYRAYSTAWREVQFFPGMVNLLDFSSFRPAAPRSNLEERD